jgi:pimeloyl-ACP methyl ester carboxylesterase
MAAAITASAAATTCASFHWPVWAMLLGWVASLTGGRSLKDVFRSYVCLAAGIAIGTAATLAIGELSPIIGPLAYAPVVFAVATIKDDVAATERVLALQDGPCILVAHSYGGSVITEAGMHPSVAGLVYVAAHMPDAGENEADVGKRFPSDLNKSTAIKKTEDGFTYLDPAQFYEYFAADLSDEQAAFMARSQVLNRADNFKAVITTAAWRSKASWMLVAAKDRTINPDLERWYAVRAKSHTVEVAGASHSVYVSRPKEVAALIEQAASHARK